MLYDIQVDVSGSRRIPYWKSTKIQAQNIFESFLADGKDFTFTVNQHIHRHLWYSNDRHDNGDVNFICESCDEGFKLSQTLLAACFAGELIARENGL